MREDRAAAVFEEDAAGLPVFDCLVLGTGIVGAACALACAEAGMQVATLDRGSPENGATAAAMGHCVLMNDSPAQLALTRRSQQLWAELRSRLPAAAHYRQLGTLWVAADDAEMAEAERQHSAYQSLGLGSALLGPAALAQAEPHLRAGLAGALSVPGDSVFLPSVVAAWLLEQARARGARILSGEASAAANGTVRLADGRLLRSRLIVIATGTDAAMLVPGLPLRRRKGHLLLERPGEGFVRHQIAELGYLKTAHAENTESVAFNVQPRPDGQLLIGSSRQYGVDDPSIDQHVLDAMLARAIEYLPGLSGLPVERAWTGFRAATPDRLPLIGPADTEDATLYLATGHEGLGITTSLATAELLTDHLLGRAGVISCQPYLPARLAANPVAETQHG